MSDTTAKPAIEKTDLPNDVHGIPGMGPQFASSPKNFAVQGGYKYPLGHLLWIGDFEYRATKYGWEKTGSKRPL